MSWELPSEELVAYRYALFSSLHMGGQYSLLLTLIEHFHMMSR